MINLFNKIRETFGLTDNILKDEKYIKPAISGLANNVLKVAQKEGVKLLLQKLAPKIGTKEFAKYTPLIGPILSASLGFALTKTVGDKYLSDCYLIAESILESELGAN
jgi:hypothetical protein